MKAQRSAGALCSPVGLALRVVPCAPLETLRPGEYCGDKAKMPLEAVPFEATSVVATLGGHRYGWRCLSPGLDPSWARR
jgi:hypothetical protein